MGVKVLLPTALRQYADNLDSIELEGSKVGEIMGKLAEQYPTLKSHLFDDDGSLLLSHETEIHHSDPHRRSGRRCRCMVGRC